MSEKKGGVLGVRSEQAVEKQAGGSMAEHGASKFEFEMKKNRHKL